MKGPNKKTPTNQTNEIEDSDILAKEAILQDKNKDNEIINSNFEKIVTV